MLQLNRALFLDMDGTIIRTKSGEKFSKDIYDWEFIEGVLPTIKRWSEKGYIITIVSNEGGVELGHITLQQITNKYNDIRKEIEDYIGTDVNMALCPSMDHYDRKPNPGMAYYFAIQLQLDLGRSVMVGDSESDMTFAKMSGIGGYLHISQFKDNI